MGPYYRPILKRAWRISVRNKWLWVLGFFAAFIGNGSIYEALLRSFNNVSEGRSVFFTLKEYSQTGVIGMISWSKLKDLWISDSSAFGLSIFTIILLLTVLALLISFGVISQAGVIKGVIDVDQKKKTGLKKSFAIGVDRFWPVLEINVITKVVLFGLLLMLAYFVSLITLTSALASTILYIVSFIVFIVCGIIIYFLTVYGTAYVVLRKRGSFDALKRAWNLFKKNIVLNLEMGLLLFVISMVVALLFFLLVFVVIAPFILLYFLFLLSGAKLGMLVMSFVVIALFLVILLLVGSWFSAFQLGAWAVLFEELELNGGKSKTRRILEKLKGGRKKSKTRK